MNKKNMLMMALMSTLLVAACSEPPPPKTVDTGRPETRSIEAASAVGYDGKAIRQKVDAGLNANDAHNEQMQKVADDL